MGIEDKRKQKTKSLMAVRTRYVDRDGYVRVRRPDHPRADQKGFVAEHTVVAEEAIGKILPLRARVHHVNGIKGDNRPNNFVVCPNDAYHHLLHMRMRAKKACGNPNYRKCVYCKQWDDPSRLSVKHKKSTAYHQACQNADVRKLKARKRALNPDIPLLPIPAVSSFLPAASLRRDPDPGIRMLSEFLLHIISEDRAGRAA